MVPGCRRTASGKHFHYEGDIVCWQCWKLLNYALQSDFTYYRRHWKYLEKRELQVGGAASDYVAAYQRNAQESALNWAKIRAHFGVTPEFPAGLASFLYQLFGREAWYQMSDELWAATERK